MKQRILNTIGVGIISLAGFILTIGLVFVGLAANGVLIHPPPPDYAAIFGFALGAMAGCIISGFYIEVAQYLMQLNLFSRMSSRLKRSST